MNGTHGRPSWHVERPALETCGNCHWPGRDSGDVIRAKLECAGDDANPETTTILQMFVGGPGLADIKRPGDSLSGRS